jgi:hypothetical protein
MINPAVIDNQAVIRTGAVDENFKKSLIFLILLSYIN